MQRFCLSFYMSVCLSLCLSVFFPFFLCPRGLTFTWWGCHALCLWQKPTELAHSFLFSSCVYFCLYGPFNRISFHKFSWQLSVFSLCSSGLISALLVLSTIYLFMKVSFSPDIIPSGWLGSKHKWTKLLTFCLSFVLLLLSSFSFLFLVQVVNRIFFIFSFLIYFLGKWSQPQKAQPALKPTSTYRSYQQTEGKLAPLQGPV